VWFLQRKWRKNLIFFHQDPVAYRSRHYDSAPVNHFCFWVFTTVEFGDGALLFFLTTSMTTFTLPDEFLSSFFTFWRDGAMA